MSVKKKTFLSLKFLINAFFGERWTGRHFIPRKVVKGIIQKFHHKDLTQSATDDRVLKYTSLLK